MNVNALASGMPGLQANAASSTTSGSSSTTLNGNSAESTFLKLLVTEMKSQDPTSPMDPTQMVGQMFSMNQLQQLIDINKTLQTIAGGTPPAATGATAAPATQAVQGAN